MKLQFGIGCVAFATVLSATPASAQFPLSAASTDAIQVTACTALNALILPELAAINADWRPGNPSLPSRGGIDAGIRAGTGTDIGTGAGIGIATGTGGAPALPSHCRISGTVEPAIGFEVWLPATADWNGRFLAVGSGPDGEPGSGGMIAALSAGYATASTDTGHAAGEQAWLADNGLLRDFGYRAIYEMTAKAGAILTAFYQRPADYRYFNGCSLGGRQGLMEAQRFAGDYDGIVAGAPGPAFVAVQSTQLWAANTARALANGGRLFEPAALALLNAAAIDQCDALDGVLDGVLEDPRRCNFDPGRLQCGVADGVRCLAPEQTQAARQIYAGPMDPATGRRALPGLAIGSETGWSFAANEEPAPLAVEFFRRASADETRRDWRGFRFPEDHTSAEEAVGWMVDVEPADLSRFRDAGGKLIVYQGWNDASHAPAATIAWYESVEASQGSESNRPGVPTRDFARLYLVPGMGTCGGGPGTTGFDAQDALQAWVERGIAPDRIEAERLEGGISVRTRPLCPYPQTARYRGSGNSDRSGSFVCTN